MKKIVFVLLVLVLLVATAFPVAAQGTQCKPGEVLLGGSCVPTQCKPGEIRLQPCVRVYQTFLVGMVK